MKTVHFNTQKASGKELGGAESNVAIGLIKLGKDPLGRFVHSIILREGVNVGQVML